MTVSVISQIFTYLHIFISQHLSASKYYFYLIIFFYCCNIICVRLFCYSILNWNWTSLVPTECTTRGTEGLWCINFSEPVLLYIWANSVLYRNQAMLAVYFAINKCNMFELNILSALFGAPFTWSHWLVETLAMWRNYCVLLSCTEQTFNRAADARHVQCISWNCLIN